MCLPFGSGLPRVSSSLFWFTACSFSLFWQPFFLSVHCTVDIYFINTLARKGLAAVNIYFNNLLVRKDLAAVDIYFNTSLVRKDLAAVNIYFNNSLVRKDLAAVDICFNNSPARKPLVPGDGNTLLEKRRKQWGILYMKCITFYVTVHGHKILPPILFARLIHLRP